MKKITYICDRCGKRIEKNPYRLLVDRQSDEGPGGREAAPEGCARPHPEIEDLDFCISCMDSLAGLIRGQIKDHKGDGAETARKADAGRAAKKSGRKILDRGRIQALRKAGWTVKAIAEDLQCTDKAVYHALKEMGMPAEKIPEPEPAGQPEGQ